VCSIAIAVTTPIAIQALIETVQSACASETPALLDCVRLGLERVWMDLTSLASSTPSRQTVPIWHLLVPTITHRLAHYLLAGAVHYGVRKVVSGAWVSMQHTCYWQVRRHLQTKAAEFRHRPHSTFDEFYPDLFATFASHLAADAVLYPFETVLHRLFVQGVGVCVCTHACRHAHNHRQHGHGHNGDTGEHTVHGCDTLSDECRFR
jgi:solute carrier family 25 protein 46